VLTLHHDPTSPASAVAVLRVQRAVDAGGRARFAGIDVLGLDISVPPTPDQLAELAQVRDQALELGLVLHRPTRRPPTLRVHLLDEVAEEAGLGASWRATCLDAYWRERRDLGDEVVLLELAARAGLDPALAAARLGDRDALQALRARMATVRRRGVGGVPVLEVDGVLLGADIGDAELEQLVGLT
jgi:2-hydroxychromene-2-carboxylate isomerase